MLKHNKESRSFWLLLVWLLLLPFFLESDLSAQDENYDDFFAEEETETNNEIITNEEASAAEDLSENDNTEPIVDEAEAPVTDENLDDFIDSNLDEEEAGKEENLPALSANPDELLSSVKAPFKAEKYDNVVKELENFEDVVEESKELAEIYVESLLKSRKPDWNRINRAARTLTRLDRRSSLAHYAVGMYYQNKSKPDLAKAITFFGKAKSAKKPYPDAAMAYYLAMVKKFWVLALAAIALPVIIIANKIKKKKAAKAAQAEDSSEEKVADADLQNELQAAILGDNEKAADSDKETPKQVKQDNSLEDVDEEKAKESLSAKEPVEKKPPEQAAETKSQNEEQQPVNEKQSQTIETTKPAEALKKSDSAIAQKTQVPADEETKKVEAEKPVVTSDRDNVIKQPVPAQPEQSADNYASLSAKRAAEIEQAKAMLGVNRPPPVQADSELEELWSDLCRKALRNKIPPHAKSNYSQDNGVAQVTNAAGSQDSVFKEPEMDLNVTIDLSEDALQEDLLGKLKMMAISDGELRSLLAQKKLAHIPYLIEYVLSKPEPVRLSLVARELGNYNDPAVIDTLASLLYHQDNRVALAAIQGLENSKNIQAVLHICPFLKSEIPLLAQAARTALSNFGAVKILQAFAKLPSFSDEKIREAGVFVLSRMKGKQVEKLLIQMLNDESEKVREKVILAMSYQKNPVYVEPLREFFRNATGPDKALSRKAVVYLQGFVSSGK